MCGKGLTVTKARLETKVWSESSEFMWSLMVQFQIAFSTNFCEVYSYIYIFFKLDKKNPSNANYVVDHLMFRQPQMNRRSA